MENHSIHSQRKDDHLRINLEKDVRSGLTNGLERIQLEHCALPEFALADVDLTTTFLDMKLAFPLLISSMTGGTEQGAAINARLASAAEEMGIAMGLGSQRTVLKNPAAASSFQLRKYAPTIPIFANLGAVQLNYGVTPDDCVRLVEMAEANALILHLNPLQEALQPEGDCDFSDLLPKITAVCKKVPVPVIIKEVGWGISAKTAFVLKQTGVAAIDIAGAGGTSWAQVEMFRARTESDQHIAAHFRNWGIPTATALLQIREVNLGLPLIASGGIRSGIEMAKCIALGADLCGIAGPLLQAAVVSSEAVLQTIQEIRKELAITLFACGAINLTKLKTTGIFTLD
jgi:isopentenyl-diphosphate delta-isomerase